MARRFFWLTLLAPVTLTLSGAGAGAAEPGFTPRPAPTALIPAFTAIGPDVRALRLNPAGPFLPAPQLRGPLDPIRPPPAATPPPPPPVMTPPTATLPTVVVSAAPLRPAPAPVPVPAAPRTPARAEKPAVRPAAPATTAKKTAPVKTAPRRAPPPSLADFSAWEGVCLLPEELPPQGEAVRPGRRLRVLTDAFIRVAPDCGARILDVLASGEVVTVLGGGTAGWYRARTPDWPEFWIGARLLAPTQQR